jgi:hypothetical protein
MTTTDRPLAERFVPVWTNRRWLAAAALLWAFASAIYFLTAPGRIDMFDGGIRHDVTESLIEIGLPAVRDPWFPGLPGRGGLRYAWYELGSSVSAIPFVLAGGWLGHGSLESRQFAFSLTTVPFAAASVALVFLIYGRLGCSAGAALLWSLVTGFATLLWPYAGSSFDAALQAFWLTLAVWAVVEARAARSFRWAALAGGAFAMLVHVQEAYAVLAGCSVAAWPLTTERVRARINDRLIQTVAFGLMVGVALLFAVNALRYGNPLDTGRDITSGVSPVFGNPIIGIVGLLFSPAKSILLYSPTVCLALPGLWRLARRDPDGLSPIPACIALHLLLISCFRFWAGEWAWGPRYLVATVPLVCIGLPFAWPSPRHRAVKVLVSVAGIVVQLLAISVDHQRYYFARSFPPFFWLDESKMYTGSPLFARPREVADVFSGRERGSVKALVPGPRPFSMTGSLFGPTPSQLPRGREWMREYLVFVTPRPWTLWSRYLSEDQRPGRTGLMTMLGLLAAVSSLSALTIVVRSMTGRDGVSVA